jgi:putative PIN family toxin of toxin-antitoxin system
MLHRNKICTRKIKVKRAVALRFSQIRQKLTLCVSKDIMLELSRVLLYPKIARVLDKNGIREKDVLRVISVESKMVEPKAQEQIVNEDEQDNKILECALAARADIIVSGDKHLLELGKFKKTKILTAREFFDSLK